MRGLVAVLAATCCSASAFADSTSSATVHVSITVEPFAQIDLPRGASFALVAPLIPRGIVLPAVIPFRVRGNAMASVSAAPDQFMPTQFGTYLGRAHGLGSHASPSLGYQVIVRFPVPSWLYDRTSVPLWLSIRDHTAILPETLNVGTPPLDADLRQGTDGVLGLIGIFARRNWSPTGAPVNPGFYEGTVVLTVTANNY